MAVLVRVVKVGGSLFGFEHLPDRGQAWLALQPPGVSVFIGGGGDLVQPLRAVHERFSLDQEASHWLAVRAMTVTSRLLAKLLDVELVERLEVVEQLMREERPHCLRARLRTILADARGSKRWNTSRTRLDMYERFHRRARRGSAVRGRISIAQVDAIALQR